MLRYYFEKSCDQNGKETNYGSLFEGLKTMKAGEAYTRHMGQYPVISLSLKSARQPDWEMAYEALVGEISAEFERHGHILQDDSLQLEEKALFGRIRDKKAARIDYATALKFLSHCLQKVFPKKVIILLDEYDVPLENAWMRGFQS